MHAHNPGPRQTDLRQAGPQTRRQLSAGPGAAARLARPVGNPAAGAVLALQRLAGNRAVTGLLTAARREAAAQREPARREAAAQRGPAQRGPAQLDAVRAALRSPGRRLSEPVRAQMEASFGADFLDVRVHDGHEADRAARMVAAHAFTVGSHLVFRRGGYSTSAAGRRVLAHELTHVLQQRRGPVAGTRAAGGQVRLSDPADRFEREAESTSLRVTGSGLALRGSPYLQRPPARQPSSAAQPGLPVQRHYTGQPHIYYQPALHQGSGQYMHAELHPGQLQTGSTPSVRPPWWPTGAGATSQWFSRYMVQGHLLNHNVGGSGRTMENLTPITKATNTQHHVNVERTVKNEVLNQGHIVDYAVWAVYKPTPSGQYLVENNAGAASAAVAADIDVNYASKLAYEIWAQYAVYDTLGNQLSASPGWRIRNGSY
jgi:Domain of unknown function (DUF4157)/DNA/RNA non-specific endonuclease